MANDPFGMLKDDHRRVERLFEQFEQSGDAAIAMEISKELTVHSLVEEELVYPILRSNVATGMADEARAEHDEARKIIAEIETAAENGDAQLGDLVRQLKESVKHHVQEEENEIFPKMHEEIPETVALLGNDTARRKEELLALAEENEGAGIPPSALANKAL